MINKKNIRLLFGLLMLIAVSGSAQISSITPEVIGSMGGTGSLPSGNTFDYTVGEVMTTTITSAATGFTVQTLTQGFHQPSSANNSLNIDALSSNSTCTGGNNGTANLAILTSTGSVSYHWGPPLNANTPLVTGLAPGTYHYHVTDGTFSIDDSVIITEDQVDCGSQLVFYHVVTPNGDGNNDTWVIDGITNFSESHVEIYNRWGDEVWNRDNYDNTNVVWDGKYDKGGKPLPDATYFYIVKAGSQTYKGWVELIH